MKEPRVDAYIEKSAPFAQPVLEHVREIVHKACPDVDEAIKWGMPFFVYRGQSICFMAAHKAHCSLGFIGGEVKGQIKAEGAMVREGMGLMGKMTGMADLPPDKKLLGWVRQMAAFVDAGGRTMMRGPAKDKPAKPAIEMPEEFAAALERDKKAKAGFEAFPPGCRREYVEWITEAKRPETRQKRIATAVEWIAEGKQRNWKYQNC